jgi:hypothetical protein
VLSAFNDVERQALAPVLERAADAALMWRRQGVIAAMNEYNRRDEGDDAAKRTLEPLRRI